MLGWVLLSLGGCGPKLGQLELSYGYPEVLPLVQPSTDPRRWYVAMETSSLGPVVWFVDTGYSYSTCDDDLIDALGLSPTGRVQVRGELGEVEAQKVSLPAMTLGGHTVDGLVCIVRDLDATSSLSDPTEVPIAGVIGMDVLRRFRLRFDPTLGTMTLLDPALAEPLLAFDEGVQRLKRKGLRARVGLEVDGRRVWPILDTGASQTYLDGAQLGLEPSAVAENVEVRGTGASGTLRRRVVSYDLAAVQVGSWPVEQVTVTERTRRWREPGLLGLDLLSQFEQDYDFDRGLVRLVPALAGDLPQFSSYRSSPNPITARLLDDQHAVLRRASFGVTASADTQATPAVVEAEPVSAPPPVRLP
jgi:predicted aspartyl protease